MLIIYLFLHYFFQTLFVFLIQFIKLKILKEYSDLQSYVSAASFYFKISFLCSCMLGQVTSMGGGLIVDSDLNICCSFDIKSPLNQHLFNKCKNLSIIYLVSHEEVAISELVYNFYFQFNS